MSRRLRSAAIERLLLDVEQALVVLWGGASLVLAIDGKPLPVGRPSKDADAACSRGVKGYKLHAVVGLPAVLALIIAVARNRLFEVALLDAEYYVEVSLRASPKRTFSLWPWAGEEAFGRADFTFIR